MRRSGHASRPRPCAVVTLSAKADYALRALIELSRTDPSLVKGEQLAQAQRLPKKFLENVLGELRRGGMVSSTRGPDGGYRLARPAAEISVGSVIRLLDGSANRTTARLRITDAGLEALWSSVEVAVDLVLDATTIADLAAGPASIGQPTR